MTLRALGCPLVALSLVACAPSDRAPAADVGPTLPVSWVDAVNGNDTNDGRSAQSAFRTLERATHELKPGWTVKVRSGTYTTDGTTEPLVISVSGTADARITFVADEGQHPVIQIPRGPGAWSGIHILGASYVTIDGFEVVGQARSITAADAAANDGTQALYNHNCIYVDGVGGGAVQPPVPHDVVIRSSILHDCTAAGIEVNAGDVLTIEHNKVYDTSWWTVFGTSGIGLFHLTDAPGNSGPGQNGYRNRIVGNEVWNNHNALPFAAGSPPAIYDGNGIIVDDSKHMEKALGQNDVRNVPYTGRTLIANNLIHDNGGRGVHVYSSEHVDVVNNTTWNDLLSTSDYLTWGEVDGFASKDVRFVNNVSVNLVGKPITFDDGNQYDFNLWDGAAPFHGPNDLLTRALLVDPANGNFAPGSGSPALKSGTSNLAPPDDYFGNTRPAGSIDRGAIQVSR